MKEEKLEKEIFEVKNRFTGKVIFTCEKGKIKEACEKNKDKLAEANLSEAAVGSHKKENKKKKPQQYRWGALHQITI